MSSLSYPWFSPVGPAEHLTQGDIIFDCPIIRPISSTSGYEIEGVKRKIDGIVMTQACDLEHGKVSDIILCPFKPKSDYEDAKKKNGESPKSIRNGLEKIRRGERPPFHMINACPDGGDKLAEVSLVDFRHIYSIPLVVAEKLFREQTVRLRLLPPYREHLSQAFARYFMRIGLPSDIRIED